MKTNFIHSILLNTVKFKFNLAVFRKILKNYTIANEMFVKSHCSNSIYSKR